MRSAAALLAGAAVGYLAGTRAGHARYRQIRGAAARVIGEERLSAAGSRARGVVGRGHSDGDVPASAAGSPPGGGTTTVVDVTDAPVERL